MSTLLWNYLALHSQKRDALRYMERMNLDDGVAANFFDDVINDYWTPAHWNTTDLTRCDAVSYVLYI